MLFRSFIFLRFLFYAVFSLLYYEKYISNIPDICNSFIIKEETFFFYINEIFALLIIKPYFKTINQKDIYYMKEILNNFKTEKNLKKGQKKQGWQAPLLPPCKAATAKRYICVLNFNAYIELHH